MNRLPKLLSNSFNVLQVPLGPDYSLKRTIHITGINMDIVWRRNRRLPRNPTSAGPLTDLPDYSFMDGRPTPLGTRQKGRLDQQREIARKIVQGIQEVDFAKEFYQQKLDTVENERQNILDNKLKPKGRLLAKKD